MKALLASTLTALVLVTTAWASNVTPAQLSALTKRVTKLEKANSALTARLEADEQKIGNAVRVTGCLQKGWNAQKYAPVLDYTSDGWPTTTGNLTFFAEPSAADGLTNSGYLVTVDAESPQC